jgi:hypothetical protein
MLKQFILSALIVSAAPISYAQFGSGIVFDPTQSAHAAQQILQANQLYTTTVETERNVIGAYNLAQKMARLAALCESNAAPSPTAVIHTSMGKHQVIWRVKGFTIPEQEAMLKELAETFGGDRACTDCARGFRLPGFLNRKYSPAFPVTSEMRATHLEYSRSDFRLELATVADVQSHRIDRPRSFGSRTRSESDWRWAMAQLNAGIPAQDIVQTLANIRSDKPNPHYYAHRTVDIATAVQWVRKGVDRESLIEGLKAGNSGLSTDRAAEIATTAFSFVQRVRILHSKEN